MPKPHKLTLADLISLRGKRALITGGASGIGKAIAHRFAEAGADIDLVDLNASAMPHAKEDLSTHGTTIRTHAVDLSQKEEIDALWDALSGSEPDILVNNAGIYPFKKFLDADEAFSRNVMEINLFSVYWMCQRMIRQRGKRGGVIINVGSIEAILPFKEDLAHYSVSKAGVIALTRSLAKEYAKRGFRVNALVPGGILTQGTKNAAKKALAFNFDLMKSGIDFSQRLPAGRLGKPDEIARMALVLASDLSSYMHGAAVPV
ncbi:MAG TPA: SDR family oxidoreductase, partial [Thermoflexales bacterium]|nr:SDR family oxidoreductase [Thermoflexales bacterium]